MPLGLSRKEQWALWGTIGAILVAASIHGWNAQQGSGERIFVDGQGTWEKIATVDARAAAARKFSGGKQGPEAKGADAKTNAGQTSAGPVADAAIDLNSATAEDLDRLPGIGAARAKDILALREKLGGFQSVDQLKQVRGIGKATLEKLRPFVRLSATSATASIKAQGSGELAAPEF